MNAPFIIPLGAPGLTKSDLGLRYYSDGVLDGGSVVASLALTETSPGIYSVAGFPDSPYGALTWEYPVGIGGAQYSAPSPVHLGVVVPVRESGLAAADFELELYLNGVKQSYSLTAAEVGPVGDYLVSGWPLNIVGNLELIWSREGILFSYAWRSQGFYGSTRFLWILATQRPFPIGIDPLERNMFSVNFTACAEAPVQDWEGCIVKLLSDAGLGTFGTDIFTGPAVVLPSAAGPYIQIVDSGGTAPIFTHDNVKYEQLSVQLVTRATSYVTARTRALAAWRVLDGIRNTTVAA